MLSILSHVTLLIILIAIIVDSKKHEVFNPKKLTIGDDGFNTATWCMSEDMDLIHKKKYSIPVTHIIGTLVQIIC